MFKVNSKKTRTTPVFLLLTLSRKCRLGKHSLICTSYLGIKNMMVIRIGGINRINVSSVRLDFIDTQGKILQANILTDKIDSDDVRNASIIPPAVAFKVKLSGNCRIFF